MTVPFIAYKGFGSNLQCRNFQYEIGKTYTQEEPPQVCGKGFHFCMRLEDTFSYYQNDGLNRFCEVEILGDYRTDGDKSSTNCIKIVKEISVNEYFLDKLLEKFSRISETSSDFVLGGSAALILQNKIPLRKVGDLDISCHRYIEIPGATVLRESSSTDEDAIKIKFNEKDYLDYFVIPQLVYKTIEYKGLKIKVQSPFQIIEAKVKYFNKGIQKHRKDIVDYFQETHPPFATNQDSLVDGDLPF
jgi:hypothetical protein